MSYAHAAGSGNRNGNGQEQKQRYFNEKMVQCHSNGVSLEKLVEVLDNLKILPQLTALQKVKYGVMYALASENRKILDDLVIYGLDVDGKHLQFRHHKASLINVYVSNIPYGISSLEINSVFCKYGVIKGVKRLQRDFRGTKLYTGDFCVSFEKLMMPIPSYVMVCGWLSYVHYSGQKSTCRQCEQTGHVFANCPERKRRDATSEEPPKNRREERNTEPENMDTHEPPPPNEPNPTEEEVKSTSTVQEEDPEFYRPPPDDPGNREAFEEILKNLESTAKEELAHVTVEDCQIPSSIESEDQQSGESSKQSRVWADSMDSEVGSEKPQRKPKKAETKSSVKIKVSPTVYCSFCQVDSHTEEQCDKVSLAKQTAKRKLGRRDSKPSKGESSLKKRKSIQGFKADLDSIVRRGNNSSDVQYIVERDDAERLYALYLLSCFGSRGTALTARKLFIVRNDEVMTHWSKLSSEGMCRQDADELLMEAYEQL